MNYKEEANEIRKTVLKIIFDAQVSHIGSNFSAIDILTVLYNKADFKKDKLVVSKGWIAATIYALGVKHKLVPQEAIDTFCKPGSKYIGLIEPLGFFGAEIAGGSMGLGFPGAIGLALAKKLKKEEGTIYVLMSDGEMQCGTTWESFLIARQHNLQNLTIIVDNNGFQAMGYTDNILSIDYKRLATRIDEIHYINGHDFKKIEIAINCKSDLSAPKLIVANTIKGKGVSFFEGNNIWHYKSPNEEEYQLALKEL